MEKLIIASNNAGKLREIGELLKPLGIEVLPQSEFKVAEVAEPHRTFIENAIVKARHACEQTGLPSLADDSGICVNALNGQPGVLSARYAGESKSDERNNRKLIDALRSQADRRAHYYCVAVLLRHADDPEPIIADGIWRGEIVPEKRGDGGFGYDPHFFLPNLGKTAAELPMDQKNRISHRGQALVQLLSRLAANPFWR
jgi:XTP/dITP diphosphohydrolase